MRKQNLFGRFLATFLAVVMVLSCVPVSVFATQTDEVPAFAEEQTVEQVETLAVESTEAEEEEEETQASVMQVNDVDPQDETTEAPKQAPVIVDIATVAASTEGTFTIKGVVTLVNGQNYYVQDATGAMCVRVATARNDIELGATIVATGSRTDYNGLKQLASATVEISTGLTLTAKETTIAALTESDRCSYVKLTGLTVSSVEGTTVTLTDGTNTIQMYKAVIGEDVKAGAVVTVCAAVDMFNNAPQLRNTKASEVVVTTPAPNVTPDPEPDPKPDEGTEATYTKVTESKTDWSGSYLIVCEETSAALNGSLEKVDVAGNYTTVEITDGSITALENQEVTITASADDTGYLVQTASGYYIYATATGRNTLLTTKDKTVAEASPNTIAMDENGALTLTSKGGAPLMFYSSGADSRFRFYSKANQKAISLYAKGSAPVEKDPWADEDAKYSIYQQITELTDGDKVVLFNPGNGKMVSSQFNSYYLAGVDAAAKEAGYIASEAENIVWTVSIQEVDGKKVYTFKQGDNVVLGVLQNGTYYNVKTGVNDTTDTGWYLEKTGEESNQYYIYSSTLESSYENGHIFLNWYAKKSGFSPNNTSYNSETNYGFTFYKLVRQGVKKDEPVTPAPTPSIESGEYVIWDVVNNKALSSQRTSADSYYYKGVDVTETDGVLSGYGDTEIWTVAVEDGKLTFTAGEEKLGMSGNYGSISNASGCTTWVVEDAGDGAYYIQNTETSKYMVFNTQYSSWQATADKASASKLKLTKPGNQSAPSTDKVADGKYVIWVGGEYNMALSSNYGGYYNNGVAVTMDGGVLTGYTAAEIWTVENQEDGTITLSYGGQNLGMADSYSSMTLGGKNDAWTLEDAGNGKWYLKNVVRGLYAQWFVDNSYWSGYYINEGTEDRFALTFTPAEDVIATDSTIKQAIAQWGGMLNGTETGAVNGDRYKVGDQKDGGAKYTAVVGGKTVTPYTVGRTTEAPLYYMGGAGFGSGSNDYMQMAVNTAGWADMSLTFRLRVSGDGPASFQLCYSADNGTTWNNFTTGSYDFSYTIYNSEGSDSYTKNGTITDGIAQAGMGYQGGKSNYVTFTFDVPKGAANCENLLIRLVPGTTKANGKTGLPGNTASTRFDNVVLTGSPIVSDGITGYVTVTPDGSEDQATGTELTMTSTTEGATIYYRVNGGEWQTYSEDSKPTLASLPCDVEAYAKCEGKQDSVVRLYHYAAGTVGTVKMTPNGGSVWVPSEDEPVSVQLSTTTEGATIYYVVADDNGVYPVDGEGNVAWTVYSEETPITLAKGFGSMKMKAYAAKTGFTDSAVNEKTFTERATEEFNIYFGQLHSHTNISDGSGSIEEAYSHGYSLETLDFLAVTDHSNSFDNTDNGELNTDGTTISSEWAQAKAAAQAITDDTFVGLYGYEMTWSNGLGHMNTYNTAGWQSRTQTDYKTYATALENYYTKLETAPDSISQFNHPGTTFGDFQDFAYYSEARDQLITLIEVGNGEGEIGSSGYFPSYEYYTRALDKGWHVAPTNNQDNHKGRWGSANTARSVVLADSLTESAIYDAMRNYRVYATEDNDLNIYYTLDGNIMGSILSSSDVGENVELNVLLSDATDKLAGTKVQVIVNGGLVAASTTIPESKAGTIDWQEEVTFSVPSSYNYYYIKITQPDGDIAVTAPVWVGDMESVGISSFTTDAPLPVKDQEMNLTLELYNNVKKELEIQSIVFQLGDSEDAEIIHTADLTDLKTVPAMGTASYSFAYTHNAVGKTQIYAVVTGTLNGQQRIYKEKLELTFVPSEMVTRVIVDGTHYNDYVTGYYGGNINNLTTIAAESQIEVSIVKDEITADMLENCQLLIISAPAKKAGTANAGDYVAKPFEDSFLNLVKDYVAKGGSVIVCGLADYQDKGAESADYHAAAQLNKLLSTIGSTMRIGDDEVYDEVNNGGQAYRLYPTTFNMDSKWCAGIVDGQQYSQYSGCTVDPGQGTWLVKGFDTTYSIDSDGDGLGGVEKGNAVFLAAEDTSYGGTIFAAGGVFVSDFEVKAELDNIWDLPYANRTIVENILGAVRTELPLSTIAQVRAGEMGDFFRTKGYVTAGTDNEYNKFFDAIYLQDDTAGITVFPFAELGVALGTPIEVVGYVDAYQGDKEIQITSYKILDEESKVIEPTKLSAKEAMDYEANGGKLIQVEGTVVEVEYDSAGTGVSQLVVQDAAGEKAKVFIDGYILSGTTGKNELASTVKLGATVSAVGLLYMHPEGDSDVSIPVLRVRNCDEVIATSAGTDVTVQHSVDVIIVGEGGTASVDKTTAKKGETVTITTEAEDGYGVKSVVVNGGDVKVTKKSGKYTFTMPDGDVEVKVTFEETYNVFIKDSKYGTITVSDETPFAGDTVTITIKPVSGKQVNSVKVVDEDGNRVKVTSKNGKWTFTMPESDVTVSATFKQASSKTGDTSHVYLYVGIMVVAILALVVLILGRKKWFKK